MGEFSSTDTFDTLIAMESDFFSNTALIDTAASFNVATGLAVAFRPATSSGEGECAGIKIKEFTLELVSVY